MRIARLGFALIAGGLAALYFMGPHALNPRDLSWLSGDPASYYLGWAFFRQEPHWHLMPTWTERLGHPIGVSVALSDAIALVALVLRPLSPLLGEPFQYLGLYAGLSLILQAYFGFRLAERVGLRSAVGAALGGTFILLAPPLLFRLHQQIPLTTHWLLLGSLLAYLRPVTAQTRLRWMAPFWVLVGLAGGINPYMAAMVVFIAWAGALRLRLAGQLRSRGLALAFAISAMLYVASVLCFGFIEPASSLGGGGYRAYSMNLLAPIDPGNFGGLLWGALPRAQSRQYEGYNYLGLGALLLLAMAALVLRPWKRARFSPTVVPLLLLAVAMTLLAASATITLGSHTVTTIPLPRFLERVAGSFRSSGRFFWPAYYLLLVVALAGAAKLRMPWREVVLAGALVIQVADIAPLANTVASRNRSLMPQPLQNPIWRTLGAGHRHLVVLPAWQCVSSGPFGGDRFRIFGLLAESQHMTLNSYYNARPTVRALRYHCHEAIDRLKAGAVDPATAYVLSDEFLPMLEEGGARTHRCLSADGYNLCVATTAAPLP